LSSRRGATIAELLVSVAIFSIALTGIFLLFRKSYQAYHYLEKRQSLQVELLRIKAQLKADFGLSHFRSLGATMKMGTFDGKDVRRDDVSCLILDDWRDESNYHNITRAPRWNQYVAYSTQRERTTLTRLVFQDGSRFQIQPLPSLTTYGLVNSQLLTENLLSLEGEVNYNTRDLVLTIELGRYLGARGVDEKRVFENYQGVFRFSPKNTQPKL
jgi:type II secretory pathway pseudopilin PulG